MDGNKVRLLNINQFQKSKVNRIVSYILPGLALDGVEVKLEGFDRYSNQFTEMAWGARQISVQVMRYKSSIMEHNIHICKSSLHCKLQAGGHNLDMEFSNFTINQD